VREGDRRICIAAVESASELRTIVAVGASLPLAKGSAGTVFLAWADDAAGSELTAVRARGWADSVGEREPGVASVSAPVLDPHGAVAAVVSVSGPAERFGSDRGTRFAPAVLTAAREVQTALGASAG